MSDVRPDASPDAGAPHTGIRPAPLVSAAFALATLAWLLLALGLVYARFIVTEPPPNVVITFSDKGLARLFVELLCLGIGGLGLLIAATAFALGARNRTLAFAAVGSVAICIVCVTLLM
jgi:hypothetical protein